MADNFPLTPGSGRNAATDQVTYSGDTSDVQIVRIAQVTGAEGSKTVVDLPGDATFGLDVDVTRLPALVAGSAVIGHVILDASAAAIGKLAANSGVDIGDVDVTTVPADPFGANADSGSASGSISAKLRFIAETGHPITGTVTVGAHAVTNAGVFAVQVDGAALTSLQLIDDAIYAEDVASAPADKGLAVMAVRQDTPANSSGLDGDYEPLRMSGGRVWCSATIDAAIPTGANVIGAVTQSGTWNVGTVTTLPNVTLAAGTNTNEVVGDAAHDAAAAGNPLLVGGYASSAAPADVSADADAVRAWMLRNGATCVNLTAAGALIAGDATNGLDVDVTRLPALVAGSANIGDVDVLTVPAPLSTTGGGTEATALRVTLANDSTGLLSIDDNAGSITVDAPTGTPVNVQVGDGTRTATVRDTGASDSLNVAIVDGSGNQITSFGGGTEYTEDVAAATDPVGATITLRRRDSLSTETTTDGDMTAANCTGKGELYVKHIDSIPVTGSVTADTELNTAAALADGASATVSTASVGAVPLLMNATTLDRQRAVVAAMDSTGTGIAAAGLVGQLDDSGTAAVTENQFAPVRISTRRAILVEGVASGTAQPISGTVTASNAAGDIAHDSGDSGNPVKVGHKAINHGSNPTSVSANDRTDSYANRAGIPFVMGGHPNIVTLKHTTITTAVTNASIIAAAANVRIVVTRITVTLDNASTVFPTLLIGFHATTTPTTTGVLAAHGGVPAGGGMNIGDGSGILGISAAADALLVTTTGNATGNGLQIVVSYYTINEA